MRKFLAIFAAAAMAVSMAGCGGNSAETVSTDNVSAESDLKYIQDNGVLKIGYTVINPLNYTDDSGELVGFETEFAKEVCKDLGVEAEFIEIDWDAKEVELNSKNIDCIWNGLTITPERAEAMSITTPYLENRQVLIAKADKAEQYKTSLEGVSVIAEAGSAGEELATENESFAKANFTPVASQATALMDVSAGTSDVAVIDYVMAGGSVGEGNGYEDLTIIDNGYESEQYGIAFRKGSDVTEAVNAAISGLAQNGKLNSIAEKYGVEDILLAK